MRIQVNLRELDHGQTRCNNQKSPLSELFLPDLSRINLLAEEYKPKRINVPDSNSGWNHFVLCEELKVLVTVNCVGKC